MNPFELQAELARQWFALVGGLASTVLTACTPRSDDRGGAGTQQQPVQQNGLDTNSALTVAAPIGMSLLFFNPLIALASWPPWICPTPCAASIGPPNRNVDVVDRIATNYRSAGGHAVATIIAPGLIESGKDPEADFRVTPRRRDLN